MHLAELTERIAHIPAVNSHIHARGHGECRPLAEVMPFFTRLYIGRLLPFADQRLAARLDDAHLSDQERWREFLTLWPFVRHTGFGQTVRLMLEEWGIEGDLSEASYDPILAALGRRSPEASRNAFGAAGITHSISNIIGHSDREWETIAEFLAGRMEPEPGFHDLLSTVPLHTFKTRGDVEGLAGVAGFEIASLVDAERAVDAVIERAAARGIVGLKNHCAYRRGLDIAAPDRARAEGELAELLSGRERAETTGLSDALFHRIVQRAVDNDLPVAIHTGMLAASADPRTNVALMAGVFAAYPRARFDLYHLNYPWMEDFLAILKRFPNTWANCSWTQIVDPHATVEFLRRAIGAIPANHIFGFGSDSYLLPEPVVSHLRIARANIAAALCGAIEDGQCAPASAEEIARLWMYDNAREFYRLS